MSDDKWSKSDIGIVVGICFFVFLFMVAITIEGIEDYKTGMDSANICKDMDYDRIEYYNDGKFISFDEYDKFKCCKDVKFNDYANKEECTDWLKN